MLSMLTLLTKHEKTFDKQNSDVISKKKIGNTYTKSEEKKRPVFEETRETYNNLKNMKNGTTM